MGGGGGSETVVGRTETNPPEYALPQLKENLAGGKKLYDSGAALRAFSPYPGNNYIPPTQAEIMGLDRMGGIAGRGSNFAAGMQGGMDRLREIGGTRPGEGNPAFMNVLQRSADMARDSVNSSFEGMGRWGSPEQTQTLTREIGDLTQRGLAGQFNQDIQNSMGAIGQYGQMAPMADQSRYWDSQKLIDIGGAQRGEAQDELQSNMERHNQTMRAPLDALGWLNDMSQGISRTGGSTQSFAPKGSRLAGILGSGAGLAGILGQFLR